MVRTVLTSDTRAASRRTYDSETRSLAAVVEGGRPYREASQRRRDTQSRCESGCTSGQAGQRLPVGNDHKQVSACVREGHFVKDEERPAGAWGQEQAAARCDTLNQLCLVNGAPQARRGCVPKVTIRRERRSSGGSLDSPHSRWERRVASCQVDAPKTLRVSRCLSSTAPGRTSSASS